MAQLIVSHGIVLGQVIGKAGQSCGQQGARFDTTGRLQFIEPDRSTLADWVGGTSRTLRPLVEVLKAILGKLSRKSDVAVAIRYTLERAAVLTAQR
jgi:hypothetical protein